MASLHFFGAANCVTGSCMLLKSDRASILVDCGLFQGSKTLKALNYSELPFDVREVDAVLLTHAHIDHSGLLPKLVLAGYKGRIYASEETKELCRLLLADAGSIQEMEVASLNRRNQRRGMSSVSPIYTAADVPACMLRFQSVALKQWIDVAPGIRARFWNAGHILGSTSIEVELESGGETQTLLFSGDLGPGHRSFAEDPEGPSGCDHVILESTYGAFHRAPVDPQTQRNVLAAEVVAAYAAGGPLLLPAFAVERTQELIADLLALMETNQAPPGPIFLDSPLAVEASRVFLENGPTIDGAQPFARLRESQWLRFTESVPESRSIERWKGWHIIIAGSGMCDAGRVRHHLKRLLWQRECTVLLTGFQAIGTLGRLLQEGRHRVHIQGSEISVRARIRSIDVYSGHADAGGLVSWLQARQPVRGGVYLNHGEPQNLNALRERLIESGLAPERVTVAALDEAYKLRPAHGCEPVGEAKPRIPRTATAQLDWHNARVRFSTALQDALEKAEDDAAREHLLSALQADLQKMAPCSNR